MGYLQRDDDEGGFFLIVFFFFLFFLIVYTFLKKKKNQKKSKNKLGGGSSSRLGSSSGLSSPVLGSSPVGGSSGLSGSVPLLSDNGGLGSSVLDNLLLSGGGGGLRLLRVSVEVQIGHDAPGSGSVGEDTTESENLTGKQVPDKTNRVLGLVVARNSNINKLGRRVSVAKSNDGDVDVRRLLDGLGISAGVGDDDQSGLLERAGDVVGEVTGGETTSNGGGTSVVGKLQDSTLTVSTGRDGNNIRSVGDGSNDAGSENNLLPGLANVDDVNTVGTGLENVGLVVDLDVLGTKVDVGSNEELSILRRESKKI